MVDSEDITLEKIKTQERSLEINTLSNPFQQNTTIRDTPPETPQIQAIDPINNTKPKFKTFCSFCHKNNHSVSTCFRRLNMLKESKPQSKSPTPSFYQHFKTPSAKPLPEVFMASKVYPIFSQNKCTLFFENSLIKALHLLILMTSSLLLIQKLIC